MAKKKQEILSEIGEEEVLNRIKKYMPKGQIDDDTAEIYSENQRFLINNDLLVENIHFNKITTTPKNIGWKAVTSNFSDLAASGVNEIIGITVGLVIPSNTPWRWVEEIYKGMDEALSKYGGQLLGGDCSSGSQKVISITAIGTLGKLRLHQANALPGDWIIVSGPHGLSRLGLALLLSEPIADEAALPNSLKQKAILTHQRPNPPLGALKALEKCKPKNLTWRAAGTDSSDGLLKAINNLCRHSKCQAVLNNAFLPKTKSWPNGSHWDNWCLNGGEDFELVLSLPKEWAEAMIQEFPDSLIIGYMKEGNSQIIWEDDKKPNINKDCSFKHF